MRYTTNNGHRNPQQQANQAESAELKLRQMEAENKSMDLQQEMQQKRQDNPGAFKMNRAPKKKKEDQSIFRAANGGKPLNEGGRSILSSPRGGSSSGSKDKGILNGKSMFADYKKAPSNKI